jgi:hypothetical protein
MRRARNRLSQSTMTEELYAACAVTAVIALAAVIWTAVHLGASIDHLAAPANNPVVLVLDLLRKRKPWPPAAAFVVAAEVAIGAVLALVVVWVVAHHRCRREVVDVLARRLPRNSKALRRYSNPEHAPAASGVGPGLALGWDVVSGAVIRQSWEDVAAMIAGARTGKTTTQVAPAILAAPGAVYTCSNKRDVVDLTAGPRGKNGAAVWIFDPQGIAEGQPTWWWNPLDMATKLADARNLAGLFAAASRPPGAQRDAYFDPEGEELLAILLLAARLSDEPLTTVYEWLSTGRNDRVVSRLAAAGHELAASALLDVMNQPDKQRAGVFGTARKDVSFLADPNLGDWITDRGDNRARFDTDAADRGSDCGGGALRRAAGCSLGRWPPRGPYGVPARRGGQRLSLARAAGPVQPLWIAGHHLDVVPPVVVPRGRRLGRTGDAKAVGCRQHPALRRGLERTGLLARHLVGVRGDGHPPTHHVLQRRTRGPQPLLRHAA